MPAPWNCLICGNRESHNSDMLEREGMVCTECGSTWRMRANALGLLVGLGLPLCPLQAAKQDFSRRGIGISDNPFLAAVLASKFDYTNSFYHRYPELDLTAVPTELKGQLEFVSCSDVLEHIPPPPEKALLGLAELLRPSGFAIISVPCGHPEKTEEFYPGIQSWKVVDGCLYWKSADGGTCVDRRPELHKGEGLTLAFRKWGEADFKRRLQEAGFAKVACLPGYPEWGVPLIPLSGIFIALKKE